MKHVFTINLLLFGLFANSQVRVIDQLNFVKATVAEPYLFFGVTPNMFAHKSPHPDSLQSYYFDSGNCRLHKDKIILLYSDYQP